MPRTSFFAVVKALDEVYVVDTPLASYHVPDFSDAIKMIRGLHDAHGEITMEHAISAFTNHYLCSDDRAQELIDRMLPDHFTDPAPTDDEFFEIAKAEPSKIHAIKAVRTHARKYPNLDHPYGYLKGAKDFVEKHLPNHWATPDTDPLTAFEISVCRTHDDATAAAEWLARYRNILISDATRLVQNYACGPHDDEFIRVAAAEVSRTKAVEAVQSRAISYNAEHPLAQWSAAADFVNKHFLFGRFD